MSSVKRYDIIPGRFEEPDGAYVLHSDYAALEARLAAAEKDAARYRLLVEKYSYSYGQDYADPAPAECGIAYGVQQTGTGWTSDVGWHLDREIERIALDAMPEEQP